jgi:hypothetical protein
MRRRVTRGARIGASTRAKTEHATPRAPDRYDDAAPTRRYSAAMILPAAE